MFGWPVILYLFLGGAGGGTCVVFSILGLLSPSALFGATHRQTYRTFYWAGYSVSFSTVSFGGLCLLADGINLDALDHLFFSPRFTYLAVGTYAIVAVAGLSVASICLWMSGSKLGRGSLRSLRLLQLCCVVFGLVLVIYTGLFLADMRSVPLWHTAWLPMIFIFSSLSCGMMVALIVVVLWGLDRAFGSYMKNMVRLDAVLLTLEAFCVLMFLLHGFTPAGDDPSSAASVASSWSVVMGPNAHLFWIGFVLIGFLIPLGFEIALLARIERRETGSAFMVLPACCVLFGGFAIRACIVMAGECSPIYFMLGV